MSSNTSKNVTSDAASEMTFVSQSGASFASTSDSIRDFKESLKSKVHSKKSSTSSPKTKKDIPKKDPYKNWEARCYALL